LLAAEDPDEAIQSVMQTLTASALRANLSRCAVLDTALTALEQGRGEVTLLADAERAAHQLVGSAGTFGFSEVSELAGELGRYLHQNGAPADPTPPDPAGAGAAGAAADLVQAREWLSQMQAELQSGSAGGHQPAE